MCDNGYDEHGDGYTLKLGVRVENVEGLDDVVNKEKDKDEDEERIKMVVNNEQQMGSNDCDVVQSDSE